MKTVAVCLPLIDGKICWETMLRLRIEEYLLNQSDWRMDIIVVPGCSLPHIARNDCVFRALELEPKADVIMFIDGDMDWESGALVKMLAHDKEVIAAACPRKVTPIVWNVKWLDHKSINREPGSGLIEVQTVGTAFMAIKREVFVRMAAALPHEYHYIRESAPGVTDTTKRTAFFESPTSWGEDSRFCYLFRQIGGKVFIDPTIRMTHIIAPNWCVQAQMMEWLEEQRKELAA